MLADDLDAHLGDILVASSRSSVVSASASRRTVDEGGRTVGRLARARAKLARNSSSGAPMRLSCFVRKRTAVYKSTDGAETRGFGGDVDRGLGGCSRGSSTVWKPASRSREQPGAPVGVDVVDGLADEVLWFVVHEGVSFRRISRTGSRARWACLNCPRLNPPGDSDERGSRRYRPSLGRPLRTPSVVGDRPIRRGVVGAVSVASTVTPSRPSRRGRIGRGVGKVRKLPRIAYI